MASSSKNILLTTSAAPSQTPFSTTEKRPPLGIGFLIAILRKAGHKVHFIDNYLSPTDLPDVSFLREHSIEYVGIYVNTICLRHALQMLYRLEYFRRSKQWSGKIVVGGPHTTVAPETIPDFVDFVVQGEGESAILAIVEEKVTDRIVSYPRLQDLDTLPSPAWEEFSGLPYNWGCDFFSGKPVFSMNTSRGCPFKCGFCSVGSIWGGNYTTFSAERVVDDIEYLKRNHGARGIYFREDNFTLNRKRLETFCSLMIERKVSIPWVCETRVSTLTRENVSMMAGAGAKGFYFGVESGSQRLLDFMKKDITVEQIRQAFEWCREFNISSAASIVVGVPTETVDDLAQTKRLLTDIRPTVTWANVFVGIPTSELYRYTLDHRLHEFIDDRGLVYLKGHDERARQFYGNAWDYRIPVKTGAGGVVNPKISVVMSVCNGASFVREAVKSVLLQTEQSFEFIIINDGSTDDTAEIIRRFDDSRIRLVGNDRNLGLTQSLINGVALAKAPYIARMDADDISLPHRFATQLSFLDAHPDHAMVGSSYYQIDATGKNLGIVRVPTGNGDLQEGLLRQNWFGHGSVMLRREMMASAGGYHHEYRYAQDYDLWLRIAEKYKVANIEEPLYAWRRSAEGISESFAGRQEEFAQRAREEARKRRESTAVSADVKARDLPLVSVIVPTFNRPSMLGRTLQSILNQTYSNVEIIVVNDCGQPAEDIVYSLNTADNITYIRKDRNGGLASARNTGIRMARGQYVAYLDDDDIYYPDHVETLAGYLIRTGEDVVYGDALRALQHRVNGLWETKEKKLIYSYDFDGDAVLVCNLFPVLCMLHSRRCIDIAGGFDESFATHEDWDLWIRFSRNYRMNHLRKVTAEYTVRGGKTEQMTTSPASDYRETRRRIYEKYREYARNNPEIIRKQEAELSRNDPEEGLRRMFLDLKGFIETISVCVERGNLRQAFDLYDEGRSRFSGSLPEMQQLEQLMTRFRRHETDAPAEAPEKTG